MNQGLITLLLFVSGILIGIAICFGLTHAVCWVAKGLFSTDLYDKFNYIFVLMIIITFVFKR